MSTSEESDEMPMPDSESVFVIPGSVLLWRIAPRPPNSAQVRLGLLNVASLLIFSSNGALSMTCAGPAQAECSRGQVVVDMFLSCPSAGFCVQFPFSL